MTLRDETRHDQESTSTFSDHDGGRAEKVASRTVANLHFDEPGPNPTPTLFMLLPSPIRFFAMDGTGQIDHFVGHVLTPSLGRFPPWTRWRRTDVRTPVGLLPGRTDFYEILEENRPGRRLGNAFARWCSARDCMRLYPGALRFESTPSQVTIALLSLGHTISTTQ